MRFRSAAVLLLLVLQLQQCIANDNRNQTPEVVPRRHDSSERNSGRRWTTSRNSHYQKIVSSYEQEAPVVAETSSEPVETSASEEGDRAKAKSHKRKQWRTSAAAHDQIPSETSSDSETQKAESESNDSIPSDPQHAESQRDQVSRRRPTASHNKEPDPTPEPTIYSNKKRRRPSMTSAATTTLAPQTMSDTLYQYFRPLEQDVPQDDIMPFLDFGRKLSPTIPTPSGANSIENKSTITKHKSRSHQEEKERHSSDEEILQEDMDVTVVKKAIERNSVPRAKLRIREQGISDFYRKRNSAQVRTTENLIGTSDSSTASSVAGSKGIGVLKKANRHQTYQSKIQDQIYQDSKPQKISLDMQELQPPMASDIIPVEKKRQLIIRHPHRSSGLKKEHSQSPLTAESTLVKTVIKDISMANESKPSGSKGDYESDSNLPIVDNVNATISSVINNTFSVGLQSSSNISGDERRQNDSIMNTKEVNQSKVLSTTVVTSVSVQDIHEPQHETTTESSVEGTTTKRSIIPIANDTFVALPLGIKTHENTSISGNSTISNPSYKYSTTAVTSHVPQSSINLNNSSRDVKLTTVKNDTAMIPLRSRDIYKPKIITSGISIPHLPRQLPTLTSNITRKTTNVPENTSPKSVSDSTGSTLSSNINYSSTGQFTRKLPSSTTMKSTYTGEEVVNQNSSFHEKTIITVSTKNPFISESNSTDVEYTRKESPTFNMTKVFINKEPKQDTVNHQTDNGGEEHQIIAVADEIIPQDFETESVPPPKYEETVDNLTFVPVESDSPEDQYPVYFTSLPTVTVPVVDTRPETEVAVVEEQKNASTSRPGTEWVVGAVNKDVEVVYPEPLGIGAYVLAILGVVPLLIGALIGARFILNHNRKKVLDESEYSSEYNRSPLAVSPATPPPLPTKLPRIPTHTHANWNETEKAAPAISPMVTSGPGTSPSARWEFPREKLRLQTLLGQGNFGQVWKAEADDIAGHEGLTRLVAVKTVKESATAREREDLLRELGIMQELGSHPNVVTLLGCCTEKEPIYLLMEYVMYGKLLSFLRDHRTRAHYYNFSDAGDALTSRDLTVFGYCVARGMDYLTNKSIIHRDLAARNVLVDHNKLCKIADFGMSRNVRDTGQIYEQRQSKGALPIRWMAPESLHFSLFTHKTDVWSFGILMWEIVTLGSTPYATMGAREVMRRVRDGYRLDRPSHCRPELFRVIAQCWHSEPSKRPTFAELKVELGQLLSDAEHKGSFVDLDSFADEMRRDSLHRPH